MRYALTTIFAPVVTLGLIVAMANYRTPGDLLMAFAPISDQLITVDAGGPNAEAVITDLSGNLPDSVARTATNNADCFRDLTLADKAKLDRCGAVVYQTLIDVQEFANTPIIRDRMNITDQRRIFEQLQLAASEVCRIKWSKNPVDKFEFSSPACEAAQVQLASDVR